MKQMFLLHVFQNVSMPTTDFKTCLGISKLFVNQWWKNVLPKQKIINGEINSDNTEAIDSIHKQFKST